MPTAMTPDLLPLLTNQQQQLNLTLKDGDSIDAKALAILGANIAILIFVNQNAPGLAIWKYMLLYGPFFLSLLLDIISIWPRRYRSFGIDPTKTSLYLNMSSQDLVLQLFSNIQAALAYNNKLNQQRLRICFGSIILTGLGFVTLLFIL